ncbi:hypothetical protein C7M84_008513 [Penaeus vannamei]|uniref:Uncharacterized protein n=1 Tax=Penaeus vannamei TaxID=6689 RepID=A0A3R7M509_PENVA|nr:hypothetical protein C7M84_008513 [Penaeus vannamei]
MLIDYPPIAYACPSLSHSQKRTPSSATSPSPPLQHNRKTGPPTMHRRQGSAAASWAGQENLNASSVSPIPLRLPSRHPLTPSLTPPSLVSSPTSSVASFSSPHSLSSRPTLPSNHAFLACSFLIPSLAWFPSPPSLSSRHPNPHSPPITLSLASFSSPHAIPSLVSLPSHPYPHAISTLTPSSLISLTPSPSPLLSSPHAIPSLITFPSLPFPRAYPPSFPSPHAMPKLTSSPHSSLATLLLPILLPHSPPTNLHLPLQLLSPTSSPSSFPLSAPSSILISYRYLLPCITLTPLPSFFLHSLITFPFPPPHPLPSLHSSPRCIHPQHSPFPSHHPSTSSLSLTPPLLQNIHIAFLPTLPPLPSSFTPPLILPPQPHLIPFPSTSSSPPPPLTTPSLLLIKGLRCLSISAASGRGERRGPARGRATSFAWRPEANLSKNPVQK